MKTYARGIIAVGFLLAAVVPLCIAGWWTEPDGIARLPQIAHPLLVVTKSKTIISAVLIEGKIEIVYKISNDGLMIDLSGRWEPSPDKAFKEIYHAKDGRIVLEKTIEGRVVSPTMTPERIEWLEEPK